MPDARPRLFRPPPLPVRQVSLRRPDERELDVFLALLDEVAVLDYTSVFLRGAVGPTLRGRIASRCAEQRLRTNLSDVEPEADFELDAAAVAGFELRTRFDVPDRIDSAKVSHDGEYTVDALADSGFIFRMCVGAVALGTSDFGNAYWDKALVAAMELSYRVTQRLAGADPSSVGDRFPVVISGRRFGSGRSEISTAIDGCDGLEIVHALRTTASFGETVGQYILGHSDGSTRTVDIVAGRNVGPAATSWAHTYNALAHRFDTDGWLQIASCRTRPELYVDAASTAVTLFRLAVPGAGRRITELSLSLREGVELMVTSVEALCHPQPESKGLPFVDR